MALAISQVRTRFVPVTTSVLFAFFAAMLPRYTDTAKTWFVLLILLSLAYLASNLSQLRDIDRRLRWFFVAVLANFLWIALCYFANGEPGRGDSFLWGRHFYGLFAIPLYFLFRRAEISDRTLLISLCVAILLSLGDMLGDLARNLDHRLQGMNPNAFGPIQLCFSGVLLFYYYFNPEKPLRWPALAGSVFAIVNVVFSMSRTTWVTLVLMSVFIALYLARRQSLSKRIGLLALIALILSSSYLLPIVKSRVDYGVASVSAYLSTDDYHDASRLTAIGIRLELWKTGWKIFLENPLLGAGLGGFQVNAKANSESYQVNEAVRNYKYVHNQYLAALATRGAPGLLLFMLVMLTPLYIALSSHPDTPTQRLARLSLVFIIATYLIGCLAEDHFEGKSAIMFTTIMLPLLLARLAPRSSACTPEIPP